MTISLMQESKKNKKATKKLLDRFMIQIHKEDFVIGSYYFSVIK